MLCEVLSIDQTTLARPRLSVSPDVRTVLLPPLQSPRGENSRSGESWSVPASTSACVVLRHAIVCVNPYYRGLIHYCCMPSILQNPVVHYGLPAINAVVIAFIAFVLLDGTVRLAALGVAAVEVLVVPQVLKRAA